MKQILIFLIFALLFELSNQIESMHVYRPKNPITIEQGCRIENGTLVCAKPKTFNSTIVPKPIFKNQTRCSVGNRLSCHKTKLGETFCNCLPRLNIFKPTNKTTKCPNGTVYKCTRVMRGCLFAYDCSCKKNPLIELASKLPNITNKIIEQFKNLSKIKH